MNRRNTVIGIALLLLILSSVACDLGNLMVAPPLAPTAAVTPQVIILVATPTPIPAVAIPAT